MERLCSPRLLACTGVPELLKGVIPVYVYHLSANQEGPKGVSGEPKHSAAMICLNGAVSLRERFWR